MIFRNHNNILLKKHFWLLINSCADVYFCGYRDTFDFSGFTDESFKEQRLYEIFCNIINVFTATSEQLKSELRYFINRTGPKHVNI